MPKVLEIGRYVIYFWSNEQGEPIHIHVGVKRPQENDAKMWVLRNGDTVLVHNKSDVPNKDLKEIRSVIKQNVTIVISEWIKHFGEVEFYNKLEVVEN